MIGGGRPRSSRGKTVLNLADNEPFLAARPLNRQVELGRSKHSILNAYMQVPIVRIAVYGDLDWAPPVYGNCHISFFKTPSVVPITQMNSAVLRYLDP